MPQVSVLMPCYNAASTLDEALASLSRQTLADFEIICVDDGSQDVSRRLLASWERREPRLRILRQSHMGIISALNTGLKACRSELVARMDADDRSHPERLERQVSFLKSHPEVDLVSCRVSTFPPAEVRLGFRAYVEWLNELLDDADIRREIFVESPLPHSSVTFRAVSVNAVGGYQERGWAEDYDLWLRMYLAGKRFAKLPESLLEWRDIPTRLSRTNSRYSLENFLRLKAWYLMLGPLCQCEALFIWGAGMMGRRLGKQLLRLGAPLAAFVDIDPRRIGGERFGRPILSPDELRPYWERAVSPIILAAVGARRARTLIRSHLSALGFEEVRDWRLAA